MSQALLLLTVPVLFLVGIRRPDRLLLLWLFLTPLAQDTVAILGMAHPHNPFDRLVFTASVLSLCANRQLSKLLGTRFSKFEKATLAFIVIFCFETPFKLGLHDALAACQSGFDSYVIPFYFYLLAKYLLMRGGKYDERLEKRLIMTLASVGFYLAVMSIYEGVTLDDLFPAEPGSDPEEWRDGLRSGTGSPRTNGPFGSPEILGQYLSLILLLFLYERRKRNLTNSVARATVKALTVLYICLMVVGIYFNQFRSVWVGLLGGYASRYFLSRDGRKMFILGGLILGVLVVATWHRFSKTELYETRITNTESFYSRVSAWLYAFRAFSENPLMGLGYNHLKPYINSAHARGDDLRFMDAYSTYSAHNSLITILAENGILLVVPSCFLVCYFFGQVRACVRLAKSPADIEFGLFAVGIAFAIFFPQLFDRMFSWTKFENLVFVLFALVSAHYAKLTASRGPEKSSVKTSASTLRESRHLDVGPSSPRCPI